MSDPFRLRVLKGLTEVIKSVSPDNGYTFDFRDYVDQETGLARERVFRGRTIFGDEDPVPMIVILEDPKTPEGTTQPQHSAGLGVGMLRLLIQGFVENDKDHPLDKAYLASAEIIAALVKEKRLDDQSAFQAMTRGIFGMDKRILEMQIGQPVHRPADNELSTQAYFVFSITMKIVEKLDDPFF